MYKSGFLIVALSACLVPSAWAAEVSLDASDIRGEVRTLPGGAVVRFSKDAKYELGRPIKLQLSPTGPEKTAAQVIRLQKGRVSVVIPESKMLQTAVLVQAPRKVSAVAKGGESVVIAGLQRVTVAALRGEMLAAVGNDWKALGSGLLRSFEGGVATEHAVLGAPKLSAQSTVLLALGAPASARVKVESAANVELRELTLYRVEGSARTKLSEREWRSDNEVLSGLEPGRYEVQARAIDAFGVGGAASAPLRIRVVGAELPAGARLADDGILLGRSGRVKLIGAEGLEASYGKATVFAAAPKDVGLARGLSTLLRLRERGGKDELGLRLSPRTLRADVAIGPRTARWPQDPLEISVKLFDHQGRPMTDALKSKPRVFVNIEPVDCSWTHSANTWTAKVAPSPGSGPWVVRVEVNDDFGEQVGRDFIELGGT